MPAATCCTQIFSLPTNAHAPRASLLTVWRWSSVLSAIKNRCHYDNDMNNAVPKMGRTDLRIIIKYSSNVL